ncbi:hypothetical protein [Bartonella sp. HY761]|uniref:hypothetical protein n=1 Tax=Bartonella sp. HY761 TaxID=2979330 RepID=UPI00220E509A|nr:hypothetical protein [Bartonella sp. HY761]UXN07172.1 hypothetical protein N6A79_03970 [Bartonella sp. HY761]
MMLEQNYLSYWMFDYFKLYKCAHKTTVNPIFIKIKKLTYEDDASNICVDGL